ncbi:hypothetical protein FQZ97_717410 [compost metagenome]
MEYGSTACISTLIRKTRPDELAFEKRAFSNLSEGGGGKGQFFQYAGGRDGDGEGRSLPTGRAAREHRAPLSAGARPFRGNLGWLPARQQ